MSKERKQECCDGHNDEDLHKKSYRHFDGSDCIGCSPQPSQAVDLLDPVSQNEESPDASDSLLPSIPEDEESSMEAYPMSKEDYDEEMEYLKEEDKKWIKLKNAADIYGKSYLN